MKNFYLVTILLLFTKVLSQSTCSSPIVINSNGQYTCPSITGQANNICYVNQIGQNAGYANWYSYTPSTNGEVTITSNFPSNNGISHSNNTRINVFTGTCSALSCYINNDNISGSNLLSEVVFPVQAGTTYFFTWDNKWSSLPFLFELTFSASSCIKLNKTNFTIPSNVTSSTIQLNWTHALGNPSSYDVQYGPENFTIGSGTNNNTNQNSFNLPNSQSPSGVADFYVRSNCGAQQSTWMGPMKAYFAATLPYSASFENTADLLEGFTNLGGWTFNNLTGGAYHGSNYAYSFSSTTGPTDSSFFTRGIALQANEQVTLTFYTKISSTSGVNHRLKVEVNSTPSTTGSTQLGSDFVISSTTYSQKTVNFTAPSTGTYFFNFRNVTPISGTPTSLRIDKIDITSVLSNPLLDENAFIIYPNPSEDMVSILNQFNYVIETIEIFDLKGRKIKVIKDLDQSPTIDLSEINKGIYFIKIVSKEGSLTKKLILK
jgi:hypothetical protein